MAVNNIIGVKKNKQGGTLYNRDLSKLPNHKEIASKGGKKSADFRKKMRAFFDLGSNDVVLPKEFIDLAIKSILVAPREKLKELAKDNKAPLLISALSKNALLPSSKGNMATLNSLFDRVYGKCEQKIIEEHSGSVDMKPISYNFGSQPVIDIKKDESEKDKKS